MQHIRVVFNSHSFNKCAAKTPRHRFHSEWLIQRESERLNITASWRTQHHCFHLWDIFVLIYPHLIWWIWNRYSPSNLQSILVILTENSIYFSYAHCIISCSLHSALSLLVCLPFSTWRFPGPWTSNIEAWLFLLKVGATLFHYIHLSQVSILCVEPAPAKSAASETYGCKIQCRNYWPPQAQAGISGHSILLYFFSLNFQFFPHLNFPK